MHETMYREVSCLKSPFFIQPEVVVAQKPVAAALKGQQHIDNHRHKILFVHLPGQVGQTDALLQFISDLDLHGFHGKKEIRAALSYGFRGNGVCLVIL